MGFDGGVKLSKLSDIRKDWNEFRDKLIEEFISVSYDDYMVEEALCDSEHLPINVDNLSDLEICTLLKVFKHCDCPYLYGDILITGEGDNVSTEMNVLSKCLPGISIETWT